MLAIVATDLQWMKKAQRFSDQQIKLLEKAFITDAYPTKLRKHELAKQLAVDYSKVENWFHNKRKSLKREKSDTTLTESK